MQHDQLEKQLQGKDKLELMLYMYNRIVVNYVYMY